MSRLEAIIMLILSTVAIFFLIIIGIILWDVFKDKKKKGKK